MAWSHKANQIWQYSEGVPIEYICTQCTFRYTFHCSFKPVLPVLLICAAMISLLQCSVAKQEASACFSERQQYTLFCEYFCALSYILPKLLKMGNAFLKLQTYLPDSPSSAMRLSSKSNLISKDHQLIPTIILDIKRCLWSGTTVGFVRTSSRRSRFHGEQPGLSGTEEIKEREASAVEAQRS